MKTALLALLLISNSAHAVIKNKVCYLEDNTTAFQLFQTSKKSGSLGITGYALDVASQKKNPVYGSGYIEGDKLYANLTYRVVNIPVFAFFDAYTMTGNGQSFTVTIENKNKTSILIQVDCKHYFP